MNNTHHKLVLPKINFGVLQIPYISLAQQNLIDTTGQMYCPIFAAV